MSATTELLMLRRAEALAGIGAWQCGPGGAGLCWSPQCYVVHRLPASQAQPDWATALSLLTPASAQQLQDAVAQVFGNGPGGRSFDLQLHLQTSSPGVALRCTGQLTHIDRQAVLHGSWRADVSTTLTKQLPGPSPAVPLSAFEAWRVLDMAANQVGIAFGYREADGDRALWSDPLKAMFELPPSAPAPTRLELMQMLDPADRSAVNHSLLNPPPPGEVREFEFRLLPNSQGLQRTLLTRGAVLPTDGAGSRLYFAVIDITQLKQRSRENAQQLEQLHQRLQLATEAAGIGTWEWDARTQQGKWDAQAIAMFGLQDHTGELTREHFYERIHPDDLAGLMARLEGSAPEPSDFDPLVRVLIPSPKSDAGQTGGAPQVRWVQARGRREYDSAGKLVKRVGVCFDVTQRHEAEVNRQAKELAEQANAEKTQFLARMSHELRTPLNAVLGFAQLLTMDTTAPLAPTQLARVGHIQQAGWHLLSLINDVLDLTHLEAHETQLVMGPVPVHEALQSCVDAVAQQRARGQVGLETGTTDTPSFNWQTVQLLNRCLPQNANLTVRADSARLAQVLVNVVSFLAKRTGLGGTVEISAVANPGDTVSLLARDDGPPLTEEELRLLFEPFSRQGPEMPVVDGTGIGLTLAKLIVKQMGGQLRVTSGASSALPGATPSDSALFTTHTGTLFEVQLPSGG